MFDSDVFLAIGLVSLAIFIIQTIISFVAGDGHHDASGHDMAGHDIGGHDGSMDGDAEHHGLDFLKFFTIRNLVSFALGYGWIGYASLKSGLPGFLAILLGLAGGVVFVYAVFKLMTGLHSLEEDATMDLDDATGRTGEVYLEIDEHSPGKVLIKLGGAVNEMTAIHAHPGKLERGALVRVIGREGNYLMVERA